ncbi:MAG: glycine zipper domain-containing protein [Burkholderiales bacterium]
MAKIIAAMFDTLEEADSAAEALRRERFRPEDISVFHVNAPGQHGTYPIGGDVDEDRGAREGDDSAGKGAAAGAIAGGVAGSVGGPAGAAIGAAVGAYTGSVAGAMEGLGDKQDKERKAGVMVAVNAGDERGEELALKSLRAIPARSIEKAEGEWRDGDWVDFDPLRPPKVVG